ncbi:hypothetical protein V6N13_116005 [Hibiscus sabdariffa]
MFDLAINTTLDQNPSRPSSSILLGICADFSIPGNKGVRFFWLFGKEFLNLFTLKFTRVNYVEVETIFLWRLKIRVIRIIRKSKLRFLRDFSALCVFSGIRRTKEFVPKLDDFIEERYDSTCS